MKGKRILSTLLALVLCLGLAAPALAADPSFTDLVRPDGKPHWARPYMLELAERGIFKGYGDGRIGPDDPVTVQTALTLCARLVVSDDHRLQLEADRAQELEELLPDLPESQSWFLREAATCLELGVVTADELYTLGRTGALADNISKEEMARYTARALGFADWADSLEDFTLPFDDASAVSPSCRGSIYLLYQYAIVNGTDQNLFQPKKGLTRGEAATLFSQASATIREKNIRWELPQFTSCRWTSGCLTDVDVADGGARVLSLQSPITGAQTVTIPHGTPVYQYNIPFDYDKALLVGAFLRVCYAADGVTPESVRVTPAHCLSQVTGPCDGLTTGSVTVNGEEYTIDRFTQVSAGGAKGDSSIIDYAADYTDVSLTCDKAGRVLFLTLTGGTRKVNGILSAVDVPVSGAATTFTVTGYNGAATVYTLPTDAAVTVNGAASALRESLVGRHVTLRVADADLTDVRSVSVNVTDKYIQGILGTVEAKKAPRTASINPLGEGRQTVYDLSADCDVNYLDAQCTLDKLSAGYFVTAKLEGGTVTWLSAYPGYETTTGTLESVTYADPTVVKVTTQNGTLATFSIPTSQLAAVTIDLDGKKASITQLHKGDQVAVTVLYNAVTQIEAASQQANITGTVRSITRSGDGITQLEVLLPDGRSATYTATTATTVTRGGVAVGLGDIEPNATVAIVAEGTRALSIELTGAAASSEQRYGTVYLVDTAARQVTILVKDSLTGQETPLVVRIPLNTTIQKVSGGTVSTLNRLNPGDPLRIWGAFEGDVFVASLVVVEA